MSFENPFFIILIFTGVIFVLGGFIMSKYSPKSVNATYGYRTSKSMKNQETWDFSQKYSSKKMMNYGLILMMFSLIGLFDILSISKTHVFLAIVIILIFSGLMIVEVELAIKKKFNL